MKNIQVYRHIRLDNNEPFYIGIGQPGRSIATKRSKWWTKITNKSEYRVEILFDDLTWDEACEKEKEFISLYGRRDLGLGPLVNMTDGGDGTLGHRHNEESKRKMSESHKAEKHHNYGKKLSDETRCKISGALKGKTLSEETKRKLREASTDKTHSEEVRKKISEAHKGNTFSEEHKRNLSEAHKGNTTAKGRKWYNDGIINRFVLPGTQLSSFTPGRLKK